MSPPVTSLAQVLTAALVAEPASVSAGMLPLLLLLLDRQVAQLCKEEPPAQAGGFSACRVAREQLPEPAFQVPRIADSLIA